MILDQFGRPIGAHLAFAYPLEVIQRNAEAMNARWEAEARDTLRVGDTIRIKRPERFKQ